MSRRTMLLMAVLGAGLMAGCASPSLVTRMRAEGVTPLNTAKIVLQGSEADFGPDVRMEIGEHFLIQEIWDSIYQSRPETCWFMSGWRRADFYADTDSSKPAVTLWINASDACRIDGDSDLFRCPKLDELVMELLSNPWEEQQQSRQGGADGPVRAHSP